MAGTISKQVSSRGSGLSLIYSAGVSFQSKNEMMVLTQVTIWGKTKSECQGVGWPSCRAGAKLKYLGRLQYKLLGSTHSQGQASVWNCVS